MGSVSPSTPMWDNRGLIEMEHIKVGDRVFTRDESTGGESFRGVVEAFQESDELVVSLALESGEMIGSSPGLQYFVRDHGWVAAREVKAEMRLGCFGAGYAKVLHNVAITLKSPTTFHALRVKDATVFAVGRQGVMALMDQPDLTVGSPQSP